MNGYLLAVLLVLGLGVGQSEQPMLQRPLDGNWWLSLGDREQEVFADGFLDCAGYYRVKVFLREGLRPSLLADAVTLHYCRHPEDRALLVRDLMARSTILGRAIVPDSGGGEQHEGPHGFYVGEYWRGALYDLPAKTAFVAGYLECYRHVVKGDVEFPGSAEEYAKKIDEWYGFDETEDSIREGTEGVPIADVLMKFGIPKGVSKGRNGKP